MTSTEEDTGTSFPDLCERPGDAIPSDNGDVGKEGDTDRGGDEGEMPRFEPGEIIGSDQEKECDVTREEGEVSFTQEEATMGGDRIRRKRKLLDDTERMDNLTGGDRKRQRGQAERTQVTTWSHGAGVVAPKCSVRLRLGKKSGLKTEGQGRFSGTFFQWGKRKNLGSKMNYGQRPGQENRRFSTFQRGLLQPRVTYKPIGSDVLMEILNTDPAKAAVQLQAQKGCLDAGLNEKNMDRERQHLFWQVFAYISGVVDAAESVTFLLTIVMTSKLLTQYLPRRLIDFRFSLQTAGEELRSLIKNVTTVFDAVLQRLPSRASDIRVVVTLLSDLADLADNDSENEWKASIKELNNQLDAVEKDIERQRQVERYRKNPPPDDFRQQPILPTDKELQAGYQPYLRPNLTRGVYADANHYLDVQFRLIKEDFVHPLRNGICEYLAFKKAHPNRRVKLQDIRIYEDVQFVELLRETSGLSYRISFRKLDRVRWVSSKRFLYGSLLLLSDDDFKTYIFATVENRDTKDLEKGSVSISLINQGDVSCLWNKKFVAAESSVFFGAYRPILGALQKMQSSSLPLSKYILGLCCNVEAPQYLQHERYTEDSPVESIKPNPSKLDISAIITRSKRPAYCTGHLINILDDTEWPAISDVDLDQSQLEAMKTALTKEISIIQGPPGTGKTYVGLKVIETLLRNRKMLSEKDCLPILLVCYTNHALDQFLEGILKFHQEGIIRVGGRSKSEQLKRFNLKSILHERRKYARFPRPVIRQIQRIEHEIKVMKYRITKTQARIEARRNAILTERELRSCMSSQHYNSLVNPDQYGNFNGYGLVQWLLPNRWQSDNHGNRQRRDHRGVLRLEENIDDSSSDESTDDDENHPFIGLDLNDLQRPEDQRLKRFIRLQISEEEENKERAKSHKNFLQRVTNLWQMRSCDRWALYCLWLRSYSVKASARLAKLGLDLEQLFSNLARKKDTERCCILQEAIIIGMTTTTAARFQPVLQEVKPKIIVIEEAAEVLEAHVVTSLNASCQQLILIGDHQQLRPKPNVYALAKKYHLDVSLFERLIINGFPFTQLELQHRMRPDISAIMRRHFYSHIQDHESVKSYESIKGVEKNVFFLDHDEPEDFMEETRSHFNLHEVNFLVAFCHYLLQQGYEPFQITILTAYTGQLLHFKRVLNQQKIEGVRTSSVDNYQGEENDIILLSFVRSNKEDQIGFLSISNRVCVSLSRAKKCLYCIGNFTLFANKSDMWKKIIEDLESNNFIGRSLSLQCNNHPEQKAEVSKSEDFENVPEGGCKKPCDTRLDCGHVCRYLCHPTDQDHMKYVCKVPCKKVICERAHPCPRQCSELCPVDCAHVMEKIMACGHECMTECWKPEASIVCNKIVPKTLQCSHVRLLPCHKNTTELECKLIVEKVLKCGHTKIEKCNEKGVCEEFVNKQLACNHICHARCSKIPSTIICRVLVEKKLLCGHAQSIACYKDICDVSCKTIVDKQLECGHVLKEECSEKTKKCQEQVKKKLPCGHIQVMKCFQLPADLTITRCLARCKRKRPCGHICPGICANPCKENCDELVTRKHFPCGHKIRCSDSCNIECNTTLSCGHRCRGTCVECLNGRCHLPCDRKCNKKLICGHICTENCGQSCPPCGEKCGRRCIHAACNHRCGEPCKPCTEPCIRRCEHQQCNNVCFELCNRAPCDEPCPLLRKCGHPCIGLCGEICPDQCRVCDETKRGRRLLSASADPATARYIQLEDCGHIFEVNWLDMFLGIKREEANSARPFSKLKVISCPKCRKKISSSRRYGNLLKKSAIGLKSVAEEVQTCQLSDGYIFRQVHTVLDMAAYTLSMYEAPNMPMGRPQNVDLPVGAQSTTAQVSPFRTYGSDSEETDEDGTSVNSTNVRMTNDVYGALKSLHHDLSAVLKTENRLTDQQASEICAEVNRLSMICDLLQVLIKRPNENHDVEKLLSILKQSSKLSEKLLEEARSLLDQTYIRLEIDNEGHAGVLPFSVRHRPSWELSIWQKCPRGHVVMESRCEGNACPTCEEKDN